VIAMSAGYQVVVNDTANPKRREWVETARGSQEGKDLCDYLNPRLPEGMKATSQWEAFDPEMPRFDPAKLKEVPREWTEEGE
jgi:hypothetical protein